MAPIVSAQVANTIFMAVVGTVITLPFLFFLGWMMVDLYRLLYPDTPDYRKNGQNREEA